MGIRILEVKEIKALVARLTYKPGWRLSVREAPEGLFSIFRPCYFEVDVSMDNTYNPGQEIFVKFSESMPVTMMQSEEDVLNWIRNLLGRIEQHERDEWIRFDGIMIYDPHGDDPGQLKLGDQLRPGQLGLTRSAT